MRIYESLGGRARGTLKCTLGAKKVWKCNVLEDDEEERDIVKGEVKLELRAFAVPTCRWQVGGGGGGGILEGLEVEVYE